MAGKQLRWRRNGLIWIAIYTATLWLVVGIRTCDAAIMQP